MPSCPVGWRWGRRRYYIASERLEGEGCIRITPDRCVGGERVKSIQIIRHWVQQYGPPGDEPPATIIQHLAALLAKELPAVTVQDVDRYIEERVIAYGVGCWGRHPAEGGEGWEHRWQPAVDWVTEHVWGWMKAAAAWLHFDIWLRGYALKAPFPAWGDAMTLAELLLLGGCNCYRLRYTDADQVMDHNAQSRADRCLHEHRLTAWDPAVMSLRDFIAQAVKGSKRGETHSHKKGFASGAFVQGMWYRDLYHSPNHSHDIRFGNVLVWHCAHHPKDPFEGSKCFKCAEADRKTNRTVFEFDETWSRRKIVRRLFVIGPYQPARYWRCQHCQNYYQEHLATCPLCHKERMPGAARSTVWILTVPADYDEGGWDIVPPDIGIKNIELMDMLNALPSLLREIVLLRLYGMSKHEIAQISGMAWKQVGTALRIARQALKLLLTGEASRYTGMSEEKIAQRLGMTLPEVEHAIHATRRECARLFEYT